MFETSQAGFAADTPCLLFHEADIWLKRSIGR
jgi:hypothetical protein